MATPQASSLWQHATVSFLRQPNLQLRIQTLQQPQIHYCKPQRSSRSRNSLKLHAKLPHLTSPSLAVQQPAQSSTGPAATHTCLACFSQHRNAPLPIGCFTSFPAPGCLTALLQGEGPCCCAHHSLPSPGIAPAPPALLRFHRTPGPRHRLCHFQALNGIQCYFLRPTPARLHLSGLQCCTGPDLGPTRMG